MKPAAPPPSLDEANPRQFARQEREPPSGSIWLKAVGFGFSYFLSALLSADLTTSPGYLVNFWLPSGLFLGALLLTAPRHWLLLVCAGGAGDFAYNIFYFPAAMWPMFYVLLAHLGNSAAAVAGALLLRRFGPGLPTLASVRELGGLVVWGGLVSLPLAATVGALVYAQTDATISFWAVWGTWFSSDLLGVLLVAPAMLVWAGSVRRPARWRLTPRQAEGAVLLGGLGLSLSLALLSPHLRTVAPRFVVVPFLIWAIIRFGPRGVTLVSLLVALVVGGFTAQGYAVFADPALSPREQNVALQISLGIFAFFGLLPAVVLEAHRRTEAALRTSESRFRLLFERTADALLLLDARAGLFIDCNQAAADMLRCADKKEMLSLHPSKLSPPFQPDGRASFEKAEEMIATALRQGSHRFEWVHCSAQRADFPVEVLLTPVQMADRQLLITTWRDISERKQAEKVQAALIKISETTQSALNLTELYQRIHEIIGELLPAKNFFVALYDERTDLLSFPYHVDEHDSPQPPHKLGIGLSDQVVRTGKALLLSPETQARRVEAGGQIVGALSMDWLGIPLITGQRTIGMLAVQSYTGQVRYTEKDKELLRYVSNHVADSIAHKQAEAALRESEERHRILFENSKDALVTMHAEGPPLFTSGNRQALALFGVPDEAQFLRLGPLELSPELQPDGRASAAKAMEMIGLARREGSHAFEWMHRRLKGGDFPCNVLVTAVTIAGKAVLQASVRDITAQKLLESQLRQSQKMEVVGQLAGGVAHDFNNILTAMMLNLDLVQTITDLPADARPALHELDAMTKRAAKLTGQLLMFARQQTMQTRPLELNAALAAVLNILRRVLGEHVAIVVERGAPDLWIEGDAGMLDAAIMNLCINARDAMPGGGTLTLATSAVEIDAAAVGAQTDARPGRFACLRISDTGCGISPENMQHIFEPFFTTKEIGKGTGLGLASVHGIVHQHQGWVSVESAVGRGTTFRLYLPLAKAAPAPDFSAAPFSPAREGGSETILLVEDEAAVRSVGETMLRRLGYRVLAAADGAEAMRLWQEHAGEVALLFTDMKMPGGMTGLQLGEKLRETKPSLKIVLMSGYSAEIIAGMERTLPDIQFLAKPFEAATMATMIRKCLG